MSNLKQFRNRIKSIKSSEKITRAMQMVAASKLQKLKHQISDSDPYLNSLSKMMKAIAESGMLQDLSQEEQQYFNNDYTKPSLFIVMTSERGLCGSFNSSILKKVKSDIASLESDGRAAKLIVIGKKGYDSLKAKHLKYIDSYFNISKEGFENLFLSIKQRVVEMVNQAEVGQCYIYYNKFKNAITQVTVKHQILPVKLDKDLANNVEELLEEDKPNITARQKKKQQIAEDDNVISHNNNYEYEGEGLIFKVITLYINGIINFALLQSRTSEEGARMTAMDNATKNARDMIDKLTLRLNRSRQAIITKELIEIISGAEVAAS